MHNAAPLPRRIRRDQRRRDIGGRSLRVFRFWLRRLTPGKSTARGVRTPTATATVVATAGSGTSARTTIWVAETIAQIDDTVGFSGNEEDAGGDPDREILHSLDQRSTADDGTPARSAQRKECAAIDDGSGKKRRIEMGVIVQLAVTAAAGVFCFLALMYYVRHRGERGELLLADEEVHDRGRVTAAVPWLEIEEARKRSCGIELFCDN